MGRKHRVVAGYGEVRVFIGDDSKRESLSEWVCKVHDIPCHIVYTDFRPTPLEHYIYPSGGDGIFLIVDKTSAFKEDNFLKAFISIANEKSAEVAQARTAARKASEMNGGDGTQAKLAQNTDVFKIIKMIVDRNYDPVIVFAFNKGECESFASGVAQGGLVRRERERDDRCDLLERDGCVE